MALYLEKVKAEAYPTPNINMDLQMDRGLHTSRTGGGGTTGSLCLLLPLPASGARLSP